MNHQDVKTPRPRSKDTGLYEQSNRGHRVIRLPFEESAYTEIVDDPELFRAYVDDYLTKFAELLPDSMQLSYHLDEIRYSKRQQLYYRRVKVGKLKYTIQPSFITPYWTANCEEVAYPLRLIHQGTSFDLIVEGYGRHADYWYRIFLHIGRFSIVGTTASHQGVAPKHLAADEKISHWCGEEICICTTASEDCLWGAEASQSSDEAGLEQGYSIFKQEAQLLEEGYQPETVNTDGWKATRKAWKNLFESVVLILCFLHGYLKIRSTSKKLACKNELMNLVWEAYEQECKEDFLLKTTELEQWANKNIEHQSTHENVLKLCNKATKYAAYYCGVDISDKAIKNSINLLYKPPTAAISFALIAPRLLTTSIMFAASLRSDTPSCGAVIISSSSATDSAVSAGKFCSSDIRISYILDISIVND